MSDGFSLFDDDEFEDKRGKTVVESVRKKAQTPPERLWKRWRTLSQGPLASAPEQFVKAVNEQLSRGVTEGELGARLPLAMYVPRSASNAGDWSRPVQAIKSAAYRKRANALRLDRAARYAYDDLAAKTEHSDFYRLCGLDRPATLSLSVSELDTADRICATFSPDQVAEKIAAVRAESGLAGPVLPSDIVRGRPRSTRRTLAQTGYQRGKDATADAHSETLLLDIDAERMLLDGVDREDVIDFHLSVPSGFWNDVLRDVTNSVPLRKAVQNAQEVYDYDLDQRDRNQ